MLPTGVAANARIKIIHYGLRKALIWEDRPTDPKTIRLSRAKSFEFTYHGPGRDRQEPMVHLVERGQNDRHYKDLLESVLSLDADLQQMVPIFSLCPGYDCETVSEENAIKKAHCFQVSEAGPVQIDFYLSSADVKPDSLINSHYGLALFFTFDHLHRKKRGVLIPAQMLMPITGHSMGKYCIWARCIRSEHRGRPFIQFMRNHD